MQLASGNGPKWYEEHLCVADDFFPSEFMSLLLFILYHEFGLFVYCWESRLLHNNNTQNNIHLQKQLEIMEKQTSVQLPFICKRNEAI